MSTNGSGKRPDEILAEIDHTRHEMDRTLSAIEHRLTPGQLVDQGLDYLRHSGATEFVQNLGGTAKQNPMPIAITAIGLAWLMALGRQPAQHQGAGAGSAMREGMHDLRDKATGTMQSASETAKHQWERARGGLEYLVNEQPLVLGAVGLAIGAVLGAAAPRTPAEEQVMGNAARNLAEKAKDVGSQQLDKATQAARQVVEGATAPAPKPSPVPAERGRKVPGS
jgi:hypothetical protein